MSGGAEREGGTVIPAWVSARVIQERVREIGASFPGWKVFHDACSGTWNA